MNVGFWVNVSFFSFFCLSILLACQENNDTQKPQATSIPIDIDTPIDIEKPEFVGFKISNNTLTFKEEGEQLSVEVIAISADGEPLIQQPALTWASEDESVVTVTKSGLMTAVAIGQANVIVSADKVSANIGITVVETDLVSMTGKITYQDRVYGKQGIDTSIDSKKPVRFVLVDLLDAESNIVETVATGSEGRFQFSPVYFADYTVRVLASTQGNAIAVEVKDFSNRIYSVTQPVNADVLSNDIVIEISASDGGIAGVFNILDVFFTGGQFVATLTTQSIPKLSAFWKPNNSRGTYYCIEADTFSCQFGSGIYIYHQASSGGDTDEYDDDVLWHEYGHFIAENFSRDESPGGCHFLTSNDLDLRLAWSEGWGAFFPVAIKHWLSREPTRAKLLSMTPSLPVSIYIDTAGRSSLISLDIASPGKMPYLYSSNEVAVAKIMWELLQLFGMQKIWNVFSQSFVNIKTPANLELFWDGWLSVMNPDFLELRSLEQIYQDRQIFYTEDRYEYDDEPSVIRSISIGEEQVHHLYHFDGQVDKDVFAFNAILGKTYQIDTYHLINGADTYLKIILPNDGSVIENDDQDESAYQSFDGLCGENRIKNNKTALSSKVVFTANSTETYYVLVSTTPDDLPYLSAGRYGSYNIRVLEQYSTP